ncbi:MAG TPA: helix-turn-helix domain-containing protein [Methylomirabilota bacterium]
MARPSERPIELTEEQERELRARAARYTLAFREVQRAKIVLLAAEGLENGEIAARLDCSPETVRRWRKRFFEQGLGGLKEAPGRGRKPAFPPSGGR